MVRNLLMNMAEHGFCVAGFIRHSDKLTLLMEESMGNGVQGFTELTVFINSLKSLKTVMLFVISGKAVDEVITLILPMLSMGNIIIDGGNSNFTDTDRRYKDLEASVFVFALERMAEKLSSRLNSKLRTLLLNY